MRGVGGRPEHAPARVLRGAAVPEPQRRRGDLRPRRHAVHRPRRRRLGGRPARQRAEPRVAARQDPPHRPRRSRHRVVQRAPRQPVRRAAPARSARCGCGACATRGASRSTGRPATCGSATSARARTRRSTSHPRDSKASTGAGTRAKASTSSRAQRPAGARDPIVETHTRRRLVRDRRRLRLPRARDPRARRRVPLRRQLPVGHRRRSSNATASALAQRDLGIAVGALTTFGEDNTGELYARRARRHGLQGRRRIAVGRSSVRGALHDHAAEPARDRVRA